MESLPSLVQSLLFSRLSVALCGLIALAFLWWRARWIHSILDRAWRSIADKTKARDPVKQLLLQEAKAFEHLQSIHLRRLQMMKEMHDFTAWKSMHRIDLGRLQAVRQWIDTTSAEIIRQPPRHYVGCRFGSAFLAVLVIIGLGPQIASHDAYLRMRNSRVWFKTDAVTVKAPFDGWKFGQEQCASNRNAVSRITGFSPMETEEICSALKNGGLQSIVGRTAQLQTWAAMVGIAIAMVLAFTHFSAAVSAQAAIRLRKRLCMANRKECRTDRRCEARLSRDGSSRPATN